MFFTIKEKAVLRKLKFTVVGEFATSSWSHLGLAKDASGFHLYVNDDCYTQTGFDDIVSLIKQLTKV